MDRSWSEPVRQQEVSAFTGGTGSSQTAIAPRRPPPPCLYLRCLLVNTRAGLLQCGLASGVSVS